MKKPVRTAAIALLALAAVAGATYGVLVLRDPAPQRPPVHARPPTAAPLGQARPRPPAPGNAPPAGQAVPRPVPPIAGRPIGPGPIVRPYIYPPVGVGVWYDWRYPYAYPPYSWPGPFPIVVEDGATGSVRVDVSPKDAAVYVDGYYAGLVDDFSGIFHHLTLSAGPHTLEVRKPGFETLTVAIFVPADRTITYRGTLLPAQPGAIEEETAPGISASSAGSAVVPDSPGDLLFDVTPKDARLYVDGYYVGVVDDFEGRRHRLTLMPGVHHIELQAEGYESAEADVTIQSRETTTYRGALTRAK